MSESEVVTPWVEPADLLDRAQYAEFLTNYLIGRGDSFVLNLNASWGMGKTYFLTNWRESIRNTHPTVYINAWKSDFSDDPMLAVMSAIYEQLQTHLPAEQKTVNDFANYLKAGGRFLKGLAPVVAKGLVNKAIGKDATEEFFELSTDEVADIAEKSMSLLLQEHVDKEKAVDGFQLSLGELVENVTNRDVAKPLFVFIDELDRCRPTYAVELLEAVKHLFSVKGIVFVVATDSEQLQHSVCAIYGEGFSGGEYLRRFFDQEYRLPEPSYDSYTSALAKTVTGKEKLEYHKFQPWNTERKTIAMPEGWGDSENLSAFLSAYARHYDLPLRSVNQMLVRLEAILETSEKKWDAPFLLFLLTIQNKHGGILKKIKDAYTGRITKADKEEFFNSFGIGGGTVRWFYQDDWNRENFSDVQCSVKKIASTYINKIEQFLNTKENKRPELLNEGTSLEQYIQDLLVRNSQGAHPQMVDITKYVDIVEMAGALS